MQTVWSFGDAVDITGQWPEPYVAGYLQYGGSAYGNDSYDPLVNHFFPENKAGLCKSRYGAEKR